MPLNNENQQNQYSNMVQSLQDYQFQHRTSKTKRKSSNRKSKLYYSLQKINQQTIQKKRQCIVKYLKKEGQMRDVQEELKIIQKQAHNIPALQVAISLCHYDNSLLKQFLSNEKTNAKKDEQQYQNAKRNDPILTLLSESQSLKNPHKTHQPTFLDFKQVSPSKKDEVVDVVKGKFKKQKKQKSPGFQLPKQLVKLKKQLYSLPYLKKYQHLFKQKKLKFITQKSQTNSRIQRIGDLNSSIHSVLSSKKVSKQINSINDNQSLQTTLNKVLQKRNHQPKISTKELFLPVISNVSLIKKHKLHVRNHKDLKKSIIRQTNNYQTISNELNEDEYLNPQNSYLKSSYKIYKSQKKQQKVSLRPIKDQLQSSYWPNYSHFNPQNDIQLTSPIQKIKSRIKTLQQFSQIPCESTLNLYYSLKQQQKVQQQYQRAQSFKQQKVYTNTRYKIKYKNLKQNYMIKLKQHTKQKKIRQFQRQQNDFQEQKHYCFKQIKINNKIMQNMIKKNITHIN